MWPLKLLGQFVHLAQNGLVEHLGVVARHLRVGVSEHLGDALDRDAVGQRVGGEEVPCQVGRQLLADTADVGQLLQVDVHLLVARHGQQHVVRHALGIRAVALQNPRGDLQQGDVAHAAGLLARLADSAVALHVGDDVLGCELLDVRKASPVKQQQMKRSRVWASRGGSSGRIRTPRQNGGRPRPDRGRRGGRCGV